MSAWTALSRTRCCSSPPTRCSGRRWSCQQKLHKIRSGPHPNIVKAVSEFRCQLYPQVGRLTRARARHAVSLATVGDLAAAGLMVEHKDDVSQGIQKSCLSSRSTILLLSDLCRFRLDPAWKAWGCGSCLPLVTFCTFGYLSLHFLTIPYHFLQLLSNWLTNGLMYITTYWADFATKNHNGGTSPCKSSWIHASIDFLLKFFNLL